jgi:CheY-like chemotaxis protein
VRVEVALGPIESAGALEFLETAKEVLDAVRSGAAQEVDLAPETAEAFVGYVDEWIAAARSADVFEWRAELDLLLLRHLVANWFALASVISGRADEFGLPLAGPAAEPFYHHLVAAVTDALSRAQDREHLGGKAREAWPGITDAGAGPAVADPVRVVIVDDTEDIRLLMRYALDRDPRFVVIGEAADGQEAVELCTAERPDVVLLDLSMPVMDGFEALPLIRERSPATKVVVHSALDRRENEARCRQLGAHDYVEKNSSLEDIVKALARHAA